MSSHRNPGQIPVFANIGSIKRTLCRLAAVKEFMLYHVNHVLFLPDAPQHVNQCGHNCERDFMRLKFIRKKQV